MTTAYRIKDIADRTGFTPATLRFYEEIGLLPTAARTEAGYRLYDDDTVERLAFIARAKQLGCSLDEIAGLVTAWDGGECGPVQDGLRRLVAAKLASAGERIAELVTLTADLQQAARSLERHRPAGRCDDSCGCVADAARTTGSAAGLTVPAVPARLPVSWVSAARSVSFTTKAQASAMTDPIVCTLDPERIDDRLDDWRALLSQVVGRDKADHGMRLTFTPGTSAADVARLAEAEQDCCRFFAFVLTIDDRGLALEVTAPDDAAPLIDVLFTVPV